MKKTKITIIFMVLALTLTGCGNSITKKSIKQANTEIASKNYDKALGSIELALDEDKGNAEAKNLYSILESYKKAQSALKDNNIDEAKKALDGIDASYSDYAIKDDVDLLKNQVKVKSKEIEVANKNITKLDGLIGEKKYDKSKTLIETINKNSLNEEQKSKIKELSSKIESEKKTSIAKTVNENATTKSVEESKKAIYLSNMNSLETNLHNKLAYLDTGVTVDMHNSLNIQYNAWDSMLNEIWGILKQQLPQSEMSALTKKQVEWISYKENAGKSAAAEFGTGSGAPVAEDESAVKTTKARCYELVNNYMK